MAKRKRKIKGKYKDVPMQGQSENIETIRQIRAAIDQLGQDLKAARSGNPLENTLMMYYTELAIAAIKVLQEKYGFTPEESVQFLEDWSDQIQLTRVNMKASQEKLKKSRKGVDSQPQPGV